MMPNADRFQCQLDRLIDGELAPEEYREFVAALDESPHHWRRCALAFLESQALQQELLAWRQQPALAAKPVAAELRRPQRSFVQRPWALLLAMAASFLLALPLGPYLARFMDDSPATRVSNKPVTVPSQPTLGSSAEIDPRAPLGNVEFAVGDRSVEVPFYGPESDRDLFAHDDSTMLDRDLLEALQESGHRVQRQQRVVPLDLDNGGRVLVPIDSYRITPAVHRIQ